MGILFRSDEKPKHQRSLNLRGAEKNGKSLPNAQTIQNICSKILAKVSQFIIQNLEYFFIDFLSIF
jgi:hypothetical protein